ncbi:MULTISPECIES: ABC transporter substrate-binding protein [Tatumella]|uniref:ABC transporter substrate-binding protein n=1 Tax=unclassified Tatumella TaxID=2649542 RepID=UPI001BAE8A53|nr:MULTISPECIES: ABC transporter substrate-binding protein [unclassified Tatumella]MBS0855160.1 ABC transporter substrate-binding protein [Tatumella sp. JGM16]MBS0892777.1 ABC transporter substrate-binding protein [Tatumella sp. JGM130]MBS0912055.1 ABC transporter substrate-binding protein [Tatumella sp. JGM91]
MRAIKKICFLLALVLPVAAQSKVLTDSLQRQVTVPDNPQRIVIGESRMIYTLALVEDGNPVRRVVGWPADLSRLDSQTLDRYIKAYPEIAGIPLIGNSNFSQLNPERIISLRPDLVILPVYAKTPPETDSFVNKLSAAHIPVLFLDFRVDLLGNTVNSLRTLGQALNDQAKTERFIAFYQQHMQLIRDRLSGWHGAKPRVFLQLNLGKKNVCCTTVSHGNLADLIAFAGGDNIAAGRFSSVFGQLSPETLLVDNPDIYIATGSAGPEKAGQLQLGPQVSALQAKASFASVLASDSTARLLPAVTNHHASALWQNFYMSPWHLLAVEFFAKKFHPQLFADLSPEQTLHQMNQQFLSLPETGTYWINN